jgi:hypothetical protein
MFGKFRRDETTIYDEPIARVLADMETYGPDAPEYPQLVERLAELSKIQSENRKKRISPDTLAIVLGNLAGILIIVAYEQKHVMNSKGLNFIKPKEPRI